MYRSLFILILLLIVNPVFSQDSPATVVTHFLDAWNSGDYNTMYTYIHPQSQQLYPEAVFVARYQATGETLALTTLTYTIHETRLQGESAGVTYDVTLESAGFGAIEDTGRIMRLMKSGGDWRIAWSSMDIFDTLAGNAELRAATIPKPRGTIYDRSGRPLTNNNGTTVSIYSAQNVMNGTEDCFAFLTEITRQSANDLRRRFNENNLETIFFLGEVTAETYAQYSSQLDEICGVAGRVFSSLPHRTYYGGNLVSHVTGYVGPIPAERLSEYTAQGYSPNDVIGLAGVEAAYESELAGQPDRVLRIVEPGGTTLRELGSTVGSREPTPIVLTIDRDLQQITAQALADGFNYAAPTWGGTGISSGGAAVVLDVNTGAILALASYPMFNANIFSLESMTPDRGIEIQRLTEAFRNRATGEQVSPGSVFKIITLAAILNEGLTTLDEIFFCDLQWEGQEYGDTRELRLDWRASEEGFEAAGDVTPAEALMTSCNPFFWQYGAILFSQVGANVVVDYARDLGMAQSYGFDGALPEVPGCN